MEVAGAEGTAMSVSLISSFLQNPLICCVYAGGGGGGAGGAGNPGGGAIKLVAENLLLVSGTVCTQGGSYLSEDGSAGQEGDPTGNNCGGWGGDGGDAATDEDSAGGAGGPKGNACSASSNGGAGGAGGNGAGGGICLVSNGPLGIKLNGTLDSRGGGNDTNNPGSIKLIAIKDRVDDSGGTIYGGWNDVYGVPFKPETKKLGACLLRSSRNGC